MKKELLHSLRKGSSLMIIALVLLFASCAIGYHDDETFNSGVRDTQLESPDLQKGLVVKYTTSASGEERFKIEWPVVYGAGGYEFTLYNVDDPNNPVAIGTEKEIIDGCTVERDRAEDTKYKVVVLALGNKENNNTTATEASERTFTTLVPMYKLIPSGTDLGVFFQENPIPNLADLSEEGEEPVREIAYDLESGGEYTMSADIALKLTALTIRGDKINRAKLKVTGNSSFISDGAGFKLKWINMDMTDYSGKGFITYNATQNTEALLPNGWIAIKESSQLVSCNITDLKKPILFDNGKKYGLFEFIFRDCVIQQNLSSNDSFINFGTGVIKDTRMMYSTFYNKTQKEDTWIKYGNVQFDKLDHRPIADWTTAGFNIQNCTFWQIAYAKQIFNSNGFKRSANYVTIENTIFVDCGKGEVTRRFLMGDRNPARTFKQNTYWYKGSTPGEETKYDITKTHIDADPQFKDPANGDFTVKGADQIGALTGDPRWLPVPVVEKNLEE